MRIGELSRRTSLSRDTIRYYEKRGLIKAGPSISEFNNYKEYPESVLRRLLLIKETKTFGFSLNEIGELLDLIDRNEANCHIFEEKIQAKLQDLERQIQDLRQMQQQILRQAEKARGICLPLRIETNCRTFTKFGQIH